MIKIGFIGSTKDLITHQSTKFTADFQDIGFFLEEAISENQINEFNCIDSLEELYKNADAIFIHENVMSINEFALQALRVGKHIFVSNSKSFTEDDLHKLMNLSREANARCLLGNEALCDPVFIHAKALMNAPTIIHSVQEISMDDRQDEQALFETLMRNVTRIMQVVKSDIKRMSLQGGAIHSSTLDLLHVRLEFSNAVLANLFLHQCGINSTDTISFFEKNHSYFLDFDRHQSTHIYKAEDTGEQIYSKSEIHEEMNVHARVNYQLLNFINSLDLDDQPILSLQKGLELVETSTKILKKINSFTEA